MLRDDYFLKHLCDDQEEIRLLWKDQIGEKPEDEHQVDLTTKAKKQKSDINQTNANGSRNIHRTQTTGSAGAPRDDVTSLKLNRSMASTSTILTALAKLKSLTKKGSENKNVLRRKTQTETKELAEGATRDDNYEYFLKNTDICKDPFYLKLCLMNARVKVFQKQFQKDQFTKKDSKQANILTDFKKQSFMKLHRAKSRIFSSQSSLKHEFSNVGEILVQEKTPRHIAGTIRSSSGQFTQERAFSEQSMLVPPIEEDEDSTSVKLRLKSQLTGVEDSKDSKGITSFLDEHMTRLRTITKEYQSLENIKSNRNDVLDSAMLKYQKSSGFSIDSEKKSRN